MNGTKLPPGDEMYGALVDRDETYEGVFVTAVRTTGIFCRPSCPARRPERANVEFYGSARDALLAGYRPCKRCRPLEPRGVVPAWLRPLLAEVEREPSRRWRDADLRERNLDPVRVRRWFQAHHGMTFHAYQRARRLGLALGRMRNGGDMSRAAYEHGYESLSGFREAFRNLAGAPPGRGRAVQHVQVRRLLTPLGPMIAGATDDGICLLEFADRRMLETQLERIVKRLGCVITPGDHDHLDRLSVELEAYFGRELESFSLPLVIAGTEFQASVWERLRAIPYGETRSYKQIATEIGRPTATRAVARANGDNRLAILIPCHRVIAADGRLSGYGGGVWRKRFLLGLEGGGDGAQA